MEGRNSGLEFGSCSQLRCPACCQFTWAAAALAPPLRCAGEKVAIKKITNAFENLVDARRTLREMKLLRYLR